MTKTIDWNIDDVIDSNQILKEKRVRAVARVLRRKGRTNYKRFLAEMQFNGLRRVVAEEYLNILKDLGWIKCENEEIIWKGKLNNESSAKSDEKGRNA